MPPSYLRLKVFYFSGGGGDAGAGVAIEKNAILSHNHHLFSSQTPADIRYIVIEDASGNLIYTARAGEFLMAEDTELGGGLSLFVLKTDLFKEWALLGDVDELEPGMRADQAVFVGAKIRNIPVGLYPAVIDKPHGLITNQRSVQYKAVFVSCDLTTSSPVIDNTVYGINNSGNGIYLWGSHRNPPNSQLDRRNDHRVA